MALLAAICAILSLSLIIGSVATAVLGSERQKRAQFEDERWRIR